MNCKVIIFLIAICTSNNLLYTEEIQMFTGVAEPEKSKPKLIPFITIESTRYTIEIGEPIPPEVLIKSRKEKLDDVMKFAKDGKTIIGFYDPKLERIVYAVVKYFAQESYDFWAEDLLKIQAYARISLSEFSDENVIISGTDKYHIITTEFPG